MKNQIYLIVPSNLKNTSDFIRLAKSIDIDDNIHLFFVNQNPKIMLKDIYCFQNCKVTEFRVGGIIPLSRARNIALKAMYNESSLNLKNSLIMFVDDDAWFPKETLEYLMHEEIRARCLRTIDPDKNKSFNGLSYEKGLIKGWHIIHDIPSICLVVPYSFVFNGRYYFNENLGLGCEISQGEESLFIYYLCQDGLKIFYDKNYIYHPFKINKNLKNNYNMSNFWSLGLTHISIIFLWPAIKYLSKYTIALVLIIKDTRYLMVFLNVWKGFFEGISDSKKVLLKPEKK